MTQTCLGRADLDVLGTKRTQNVLFQGRRWVQLGEAAKLLCLSPAYLKRLVYQDRIDGFTVERRNRGNGRTFHSRALDEVMRAMDGADLSRRLRESRDPDD